MATYGSAVSIVKGAIYSGLTTTLGTGAAVLYDAPSAPDQLISGTDERVFVAFGDEITDGDLSETWWADGVLRFDERFSLPLRLVVIDDQRSSPPTDDRARQLPVDQRMDRLLGDVLGWLANQDNVPDSGGVADEMQIHWATPESFRRVSGSLSATAGRWVLVELSINVFAHKEP